MNAKRLQAAQKEFLSMYPGGFDDPAMQEIGKKHKVTKMFAMAQEIYQPAAFTKPKDLADNMIKLVTTSSVVSMFEKPKFRDFVKGLAPAAKKKLAGGLHDFLHGKGDAVQSAGFDEFVRILQEAKLGKWTLVTLHGAYLRPNKEVFMKPTVTKNVIQHYELPDLKYTPTPSFSFYKKYRGHINKMKKACDKSIQPSNIAFTGFLMATMPDK